MANLWRNCIKVKRLNIVHKNDRMRNTRVCSIHSHSFNLGNEITRAGCRDRCCIVGRDTHVNRGREVALVIISGTNSQNTSKRFYFEQLRLCIVVVKRILCQTPDTIAAHLRFACIRLEQAHTYIRDI